MSKEVQKIVDAWYDGYVKEFGRSPSWGELTAKIAEIEKSLRNKG